jgi:hypothetical protein
MDVLVIGNFYSAREERPTRARQRDEAESPATYDIAPAK